MSTNLWFAIIDVVFLIGIIGGFLLKTRILKHRLKQIVEYIIDDIKDHDRVNWQSLDPELEKLLKAKWSEVIKRGTLHYKEWVKRTLATKTNRRSNLNRR